MRKLRLAVVGIGDIGRYIAAFARYDPLFAPHLVVDTDARRAEAGAKRYRFARLALDYREALSDPDVDALYLGVPHHLHYRMLLDAIEAGKPVLCEKPITIRTDHAREVISRAQEAAVPVAVNYQYRYEPGAARLITAMRAGALGRLRYARVNVPWYRDSGYFTKSRWHASVEEAGGGTLLTQASHALDIALAAIAIDPVSVWGWSDALLASTPTTDGPPADPRGIGAGVERAAFATIRFAADRPAGVDRAGVEAGGVDAGTDTDEFDSPVLQLTSSMLAVPERTMTVELYCSNATAVWSYPDRPRLRLYRASAAGPNRSSSPRTGARRLPAAPSLPVGLHPVHRSMRGFRRWVFGGERSLNAAETALPVLTVIEACYESARAGSIKIDVEDL